MNDTLITIVAIFIAAILMFVFPLMTIADRNDDVAKQTVQQSTVEFVDQVRNVGAINQADLDAYKEDISSLGHTFNVDIEVKKIDNNIGKKTTWTTSSVVGENVYFSVYTDTIEEQVYSNGKYTLKEGDIVSVSATNTDITIAQSLRNVFYAIAGKGTYQISGAHSGVVQNNGSN
ncbi:MAG: hypothetical protein ACI4VN_00995 [Clostridia bacterium]